MGVFKQLHSGRTFEEIYGVKMAMKKYADGDGKLEVLRGHEAEALARFESKVGKSFADLDNDERKELHKALDEASKQNAEDERAAKEALKAESSDSEK